MWYVVCGMWYEGKDLIVIEEGGPTPTSLITNHESRITFLTSRITRHASLIRPDIVDHLAVIRQAAGLHQLHFAAQFAHFSKA